MSYRKVVFANNEFYHLFNRGVEEREIFLDKRDFNRFLEVFLYYRQIKPPTRFSFRKRVDKKLLEKKRKSLVEIICYCLMPTHFHFLLRQLHEGGISLFLSRVSNSYARYFNTRRRRAGHLFQGPFKAVRIENDEQLLHLSRYIHLNPVTALLVKNPEDYPYSSYREYLQKGNGICQKDWVLSHFSSPQDYHRFVLDQKDYALRLKEIQRLVLD